MSSETGIPEILALIARLRQAKPIMWEDAQRMHERQSVDFSATDISDPTISAHLARYGAKAFQIDPPHGKFYGGEADQDLIWNVKFLGLLLDDWFANGYSVPPHWAERICILLRKRKRSDLEKRFLVAFLPHYITPHITTANSKILARAVKIGLSLM